MSIRSTLSFRLQDLWTGTPWYGDSSARILDEVTHDDASRQVIAGVHTIWEIVLHMTAWTETVAARVRGSGAKPPERGDWPPVPEGSPGAWANTLHELAEARKDLLRAIDETHEEDIQVHVRSHSPPFADTGISRAGTVAGLIQHDAYHLGQVALLKRALRSAPRT
ncbi:MAG: DinB family protein [Gemmatimonadaceae bacterium]|nr:DinB family protein [Gemmatimonadaceae bacterium]